MKFKKMSLFKAIGFIVLSMFTLGMALPFLINSNELPLWLIIFLFWSIIAVWMLLLENTYNRLKRFMLKAYKRTWNEQNKHE